MASIPRMILKVNGYLYAGSYSRSGVKDPKVWQNIFNNYDNSKPSWNSVLYAEVFVVSLAE